MKRVYRLFCIAVAAFAPTISMLFYEGSYNWLLYIIAYAFFIMINFVPSLETGSMRTPKLKSCIKGAELLRINLISTLIATVIWIIFLIRNVLIGGNGIVVWLVSLLVIFVSGMITYWNGVIRLMAASSQVGIVRKTTSLFWGWIFPVNFIVLPGMIKKAEKESRFENNKILVNEQRRPMQVCRTKYPLLMVHGVFFRDYKPSFLNYWGRISRELQQNGATIYYGNQQSAASVERCGAELAERIKQIVAETGCQKVNIIAHSKGGLDSRAAIARYGVEDMVASLTTINTPHRGCEFADYLLGKFGQGFKDKVSSAYNAALSKLGDPDPNFIEAVTDLTHENCEKFNNTTPDSEKVFYQSIGTYMITPSGGRFPLNFSYHLVKYFDGRNDGLVGEKSFPWGKRFNMIAPAGPRGISHGDMIDLNRENIDGFDVREFYVQLVSDLKNMGF